MVHVLIKVMGFLIYFLINIILKLLEMVVDRQLIGG